MFDFSWKQALVVMLVLAVLFVVLTILAVDGFTQAGRDA